MVNFAATRERDNKGRFVRLSIPSGFDVKKYRKEYYLKNKEKRRLQSLEWGRKNKEKRKIIKNRWRAKNKEYTNFLTRQYHYRRKNAVGKVSFEEVQNLYKLIPLCAYCNTNKSNTIDHIIPLSKGGTNDLSNLIPVCINCNSKKRDKTLWEFKPLLALMWDRASTSNYL